MGFVVTFRRSDDSRRQIPSLAAPRMPMTMRMFKPRPRYEHAERRMSVRALG